MSYVNFQQVEVVMTSFIIKFKTIIQLFHIICKSTEILFKQQMISYSYKKKYKICDLY